MLGVAQREPTDKRLVVTVEEAAGLLGISRGLAYEGVRQGTIPSVRIGRRLLVPLEALRRVLGQAGRADTEP